MRRLLPTVLVALLAASSIGATAAEDDPPASARTSVQLLDAGLSQPDGSTERAGLGLLRLVARRDGAPWAGMDLVGAALADREVAAWSATTDGGDERSGGVGAPLPETAGVDAELRLIDYLVRARGGEAVATLSSVRGAIGLDPLTLTVEDAGPALSTEVTDRSSAATSLELGTVALTLGDLLPPGIVDHLPLGVVIDLLGRLPVPVPTVTDLVALVEQLVIDLTAVADADAALDGARAELNELVGDAPGVAAAEDAVATAQAALVDATAELAAALADREDLRSVLADAQADLAGALADAADEQADLQAALDDAETAKADAQAAVATAEGALADAEQDLADAEADLAAAQADRTAAQQTVDGLEDDITSVEGQIADLEAQIDLLNPLTQALQIDDLEEQIATKEAQQTQLAADLTTAQSELDDASAAVTAATTAVSTAQTAVTAAKDALAGAEADLADAEQAVADAEDALADASPAVAAAQQAVAAAQAGIADADQLVAAARATADTAEGAVTAAEAELDALVDEAAAALGATATALREEVTWLRGEVETVLGRVTAHAATLPDLGSLLDELRDGLAGVPIVSLEGVSLLVALVADADGGRADATCTLDTITVLGRTVADPTCAEAGELLSSVPEALGGLLAVLPIDDLPVPRIAGLSVATDAGGPEDGVTWATARATGLALEIPSVSLAGLADELTGRIDGLLADALAAARALPEASGATTDASDLSLTSVASTLGDLRTQLDGLPIGTQLAGRRTIGVDVTVGHLAAEVLHGVATDGPLELGSPYEATAPAPAPGAPPGGAPGRDDGSGAPGGPPSLPATGGGLGLLSLTLLGAALLLNRRRTR